MPLHWDHTMINVTDLDQSIADFGAQGIFFSRGGQHVAWGTANALGYFGINYIELISVYDQSKAAIVKRADAASVYDAIQDFTHGIQRFNTVAIRSSNLTATWQRLKRQGIKVGPITEGQRLDEQGRLIKWQIFFINDTIHGLPYPFFIDWQSRDADRMIQLQQQGLMTTHPAGNLKVIQATFSVEDPKIASEKWAKLLNSSAIAKGTSYIVPLQERRFEFLQGPQNRLQTLRFEGGSNSRTWTHAFQIGQAEILF